MVNKDFNITEITKDINNIDLGNINYIEKLLLEYPYFQTGQLILTKALSNTSDSKYSKQLKKAAAYSINRKKLFTLIIKDLEKKDEETIIPDKTISFTEDEYYSFSQWLAITQVKKIKRNNINQAENIINNFISNKNTIRKTNKEEFFKPSQAAQDSLIENKEIITPTLAKIYMEQEHFEMALMAYKKLCLKYPKKSSFFANQIKIINNKLK